MECSDTVKHDQTRWSQGTHPHQLQCLEKQTITIEFMHIYLRYIKNCFHLNAVYQMHNLEKETKSKGLNYNGNRNTFINTIRGS